MASEYLVLTDIASNLSTYVQNRVSEELVQQQQGNIKGKFDLLPRTTASSKAPPTGREQGTISDDAKLLLNFKDAAPRPDAKERINSLATTISPSFSFEAQRLYEEVSHSPEAVKSKWANRVLSQCNLPTHFMQCDSDRTFSFSFPSLSLSDVTQHHVPVESKQPKSHTTSPPQLFSRLIKKRSTLNVSDIAETLANNVMLSFITALEWRTKVWVKDLSSKLSLSFNQEAAKIKKGESFSESKKKSSKTNGKKNIDSSNKGRLDELKAKFKKSQEARVIKALSQTWSTVHVHDIRTTFFVLERQCDPISSLNGEEKKSENESFTPFVPTEVCRPFKKCRKVTDEFSNLSIQPEPSAPVTKYTLSHVLNLDSRCSVSTSSEEKISVSLQTPGAIHGTFVRDEDGEVFLVDLSIELDAENLAVSMEQKSRFVVRTAAEECIVSPPSITKLRRQTPKGWNRPMPSTNYKSSKKNKPSKSYAPDTPFASHPETISDRALVTPNENGFVSSDSEDMPPPPPRFTDNERKCTAENKSAFLHPRRVSPTSGLNSSPNFLEQVKSPTPDKTTPYDLSTNATSFPALVSPNLRTKIATSKGEKGLIDGNGPLLPALVEVACAAHTDSLE